MFKLKSFLCFFGLFLAALLSCNSNVMASPALPSIASTQYLVSTYDKGYETYHSGRWTGYESTSDLSHEYLQSDNLSKGVVYSSSNTSTVVGFITNYMFHSTSTNYTRSIANGGSKDGYVRDIQYELYKLGYFSSITQVDGYFGPGTQTAVKNFQFTNSLSSDGIVGYNTWLKLSSDGLRSGSGTPLIVAK